MAGNNYLLSLLAGLDIKGSTEEVKKGVAELKKLLPSLEIEIEGKEGIKTLREELKKAGKESLALTKALKEVEREMNKIGRLKEGSMMSVQAAENAERMQKAMNMLTSQKFGSNITVLKSAEDELGQLNKMTVMFKDMHGVIKKMNLEFDKDAEGGSPWNPTSAQQLSYVYKEEFKKIVKSFKDAQSEITNLQKKQTTGTITQQEEFKLQQLIESQLEKRANLQKEINALVDYQIFSEQRGKEVLKEQNQILSQIEAKSETRVQEKKSANTYKQASDALKEYKADLERFYKVSLEMDTNVDSRTQSNRELLETLKNRMNVNTQLIDSYKKLKQEREAAEANIAAKAAENKAKAETKLVDQRLADVKKLRDEEIKIIKEIYAAERAGRGEKAQDLKSEQQVIQARRSEEISSIREIITSQDELGRFEKKINEQSIQQAQAKTEATKKHNEAIKEQARIRDAQYGKEVSQGITGKKIGPVSLETFESPEKVRELTKALAGQEAEYKRITNTVDKHGNAMRKLMVTVSDKQGKLRQLEFVYDDLNKTMRANGEVINNNIRRNMGWIGQLGSSFKHLATIGVAYRAIGLFTRSVREAIVYTQELDKELTQVAVVQNRTRESVKYLAQEYASVGMKIGATVEEVSRVNTELIRQGLSLEESRRRLDTIMKLAKTGMIESQESLKIITSAVNAMQVGHERAADVILRASQISASSVEELGEAFTKTASSAFAAGVEIEEMGAVLATLIEVTQEGPRQVGTSLKTILARFNRVNEETGEFNDNLNAVQSAVESVGVKFTDADGQIRSTYDVLQDLSDVWGTLTKNQQAYIATTAAGKQYLMPAQASNSLFENLSISVEPLVA